MLTFHEFFLVLPTFLLHIQGHGFRTELISMMLDLKPRFLRFPGGCFVEGEWLRNAFRWRESIGPWEERPGHFGDVWHYWTDDGLGYYEFLQLSEDLGAAPIWVFNNGISHNDEVDTAAIAPFVKDVLDSLEFARGSAESTWGSARAAMGHPEPFPVKYVAIGNEDCGKKFYRGNYLKFYNAIREAYPDIQMISNCDASSGPLDHPADLYDFHVYTDSNTLFSMKNTFDGSSRNGTKAFVSEYAVWRSDAGRGSLLASLAEAAFLTGLEKNSDVVWMASYAPLFVNDNDQTWNPDAIVFNSWQQYGTPSYWMQTLFCESSGALIHPITTTSSYSGSLAASAITWQDSENSFLRVKIVNFGSDAVSLTISATGLQVHVNTAGSTVTVLTSGNVMDENSFSNPNKVVPVKSQLPNAAEQMQVMLSPHSFTSLDLALAHQVAAKKQSCPKCAQAPAHMSPFTGELVVYCSVHAIPESEEDAVIRENEPAIVKRLKKLLMLSTDGTLNMHALWLIRRELALPDDYRDENLAIADVEEWRAKEYAEKCYERCNTDIQHMKMEVCVHSVSVNANNNRIIQGGVCCVDGWILQHQYTKMEE
ncbi:hypothetical protein GUJ93_ZPchr0011g28773 [Zizania palustris]|uniref:Alpha-L-arabinofuranosidase C-terminal domain-containing protein n=1 Tax=Zizania palustris TaxID=103762 RepID=A0A8J5WHW6_ZIZPA|nr:hypothetical protein GUJ93_ZPchr0011g28773 [Zizania palustris]